MDLCSLDVLGPIGIPYINEKSNMVPIETSNLKGEKISGRFLASWLEPVPPDLHLIKQTLFYNVLFSGV